MGRAAFNSVVCKDMGGSAGGRTPGMGSKGVSGDKGGKG